MNKIITDCNKYYNGDKGESEYLETTNNSFCHMVEFICNIFISFISHIPMWQERQANSVGERVVSSSANDAGTNLDPCFTLYTKLNSKCIIDLNVRAKAIKLLEENIGINLCELRHWFLAVFLPFLGSDTKSTYDDRKINWTLLELKKKPFSYQRIPSRKWKRQPMEWRKLFTNLVWQGTCIQSRIYKGLLQLNNKKTTTT